MSYLSLAWIHLATVIPAAVIGSLIMLLPKGNSWHKNLGRLYISLLLASVLITLWMPSEVGPRLVGIFGYIHILSLASLLTLPLAYWAARFRYIRLHRGCMIGLYVGGILFAGSLSLLPGRMLNGLLLG